MPPKIDGILESSLYVSNLTRSIRFYREVFGLPPPSVSTPIHYLIARYPFAAAARSPSLFRSNPQQAVTQSVPGHT